MEEEKKEIQAEKKVKEPGYLSKEEYQRCLTAADMATFVDADSVEKPKSIFVVAQPGAGKTALKSYIIASEQSNGRFSSFIEFNPDVISTHHKDYRSIIEEHPDDSYSILQNSFTRTALDGYLRPRAVQIRCNIMQEGTFGSTDGYLKILEFQQNGGEAPIGEVLPDGTRAMKSVRGGYEVEIGILAVNRYESLLSCFDREQFFEENGLPPRAVTINNHDNSYIKMLHTIDEVERRKLFDQMKVYRRGYIKEKPELIYMAGDPRFPSVSEAIRHERKRQELELFEKPDAYIAKLEELKAKVGKGNNESLKTRIGILEKEFYAELEKHQKSKVME